MKWILLYITAFLLSVGTACFNATDNNTLPISEEKEIATCYGKTPCTACTSCNYCKWCKAGGTCGICSAPLKSKPTVEKKPSGSTAQCKAITKKGTRCSRKSGAGAYCWQHD